MNNLESIFEELGFDRREVRQPQAAVVYAIARTYNLVMRHLEGVYQRFGLSAPSFNLLLLLQRGRDPESLTQRVLAERLVISPSNLTGLVDRLERKGLVRRIPGSDRRTNHLQITPKGSQLLEKIWPHHAEAMERLSAGLQNDERDVLGRALSCLRHALTT